nr:hypothetical protein [uncultured Sphaerochaeta sp.]
MSDGCLLNFDANSRRLWMFSRNIRSIYPWKLSQILKVIMQVGKTEDIGSQATQMTMYSLLSELGLKRKADIRDTKSGGMRTYYAQMESLGFLYRKKDSGNGTGESNFGLTIAGEAMINSENPLKVLQYSLLRYQYPSVYSRNRNVQIDGRIQIKPMQFLLQLMMDERLGGHLSDYEIQIPVMYGHSNKCFDYCVNLILRLRSGEDILDVMNNPATDMYTPRSTSSDINKALSNLKDIANTGRNFLSAADLIIQNSSPDDLGRISFSINPNYKAWISALIVQEGNRFIDNPENNESFQRAYGRYLNAKDTRRDEDTSPKKLSGAETLIQIKYVDYINKNPFMGDEVAEFISSLNGYGFRNEDISTVIAPLQKKKNSLEDNIYLEYAYSGGKKSNEFEKATTNLLIQLGFDESIWIGRKISKNNWRGNYTDVLIQRSGSLESGFAEVKATYKYSFEHTDMLKMVNTYVPSFAEISPPNHQLKYYLYIAGGFCGDVDTALKQLSEKVHIAISAITAQGLLSLRKRLGTEINAEFVQKNLFEKGVFFDGDDIAML